MLCTPKPNGFADHYPVFKWLFHWEYTQHFQTNPDAERESVLDFKRLGSEVETRPNSLVASLVAQNLAHRWRSYLRLAWGRSDARDASGYLSHINIITLTASPWNWPLWAVLRILHAIGYDQIVPKACPPLCHFVPVGCSRVLLCLDLQKAAWHRAISSYRCQNCHLLHAAEIWVILDEGRLEEAHQVNMGLSENRVYSQWNSHLIGIMIINHWL